MLPFSNMVCTCCQLHCIPRSCCYLTAPNPQAVWHLLEVNWVHYLIAISTGGFQFVFLHANSKQTTSQQIQAQKKTNYPHLICFISTSIPSSNRSLLSGIRIANPCVFFLFFFQFQLGIWVDFMVPRVMKHAPHIMNRVNIQHGWNP